jgi:hypothetical protein
LRNIPRSKILRAAGHSSEKAFSRYICYDENNSKYPFTTYSPQSASVLY